MSRVLIFGYSKSGRDLAKELKLTGYDVVVLNIDEQAHVRAVKDRYEAYHDTIIDDELLTTLGIGYSIEALFCMSRFSAENLFVTLSARHLSKNLKIVSVVRSQSEEKRMLLAGANRTLNPYSIGAMSVLKLIQRPHLLPVIHNILFSQDGLELAEIIVPENSFLDKQKLIDVDIEANSNVVLLGFLDVEDEEEKFIFLAQGLHHVIDAQERIVVLGHKEEIENFRISLEESVKQ